MIFKYKDLQQSHNVELDIDNIEMHAASIIRSMNMLSDGSLVYNETIDYNLIELIGESETEQEVIDRISGAQPYILDPTSGQYLNQQLERYTFFLQGTGHKDKYMDFVAGVPSNILSYKIQANTQYTLQWIQFENTYPCSGNIIDIIDVDTSTILYSVDVGPTITTSYYVEGLAETFTGPLNLGVYINNNRLDTPAIVFGVREVYQNI